MATHRSVVRLRLFALAFLLTAVTVFMGNAGTDLVLGDPLFGGTPFGFIDAPDVLVLHLIFTGLPFFALALLAETRGLLWITAVAFSLLTWTYAAWQVWRDSLTGFAGGANIGLGLIMMGAPIVITALVVAFSMVTNEKYK
jgi:hypothetical protein